MPIIRIGETCWRCAEEGVIPARPVWKDGLCSACYRLLAMFGRLDS